jgi:hypothetical protein
MSHSGFSLGLSEGLETPMASEMVLDLRIIAVSFIDRCSWLDIRLYRQVSRNYQPITAILYTSRMTTAASAVQADSV